MECAACAILTASQAVTMLIAITVNPHGTANSAGMFPAAKRTQFPA
jgi:hypothetical protein